MALDSGQANGFANALEALIDNADAADLQTLRDVLQDYANVVGATSRKLGMDAAGVGYNGYEDMAPDIAEHKAAARSKLGV